MNPILTSAEEELLTLAKEVGEHLVAPLLKAILAGDTEAAASHVRIALAAGVARRAVTEAAKLP
jgi:hypothetical protein